LGAVAYGVKKGELADERSRFAAEKERSERKIAEQLRQVLVDRAEAIRLAKAPGYRHRVWADLRQAIALPAGGEGVDRVRPRVLACLGDPIGLDPVQDVQEVRRRTLPALPPKLSEGPGKAANGGPIAVSPRGDLVAVTGGDRRVAVYGLEAQLIRQEESPLGAV